VFCDFGPDFFVFDANGEEPRTGIIASISNDNPALVSCVDDERFRFLDNHTREVHRAVQILRDKQDNCNCNLI